MTPDYRTRAMAAGGLWGSTASLTQAAFAPQPFYSLTVSAIALTIVLTLLYLIDGKLTRRTAEKDRSCHRN